MLDNILINKKLSHIAWFSSFKQYILYSKKSIFNLVILFY